jgi:transglutaminase-like putative cysteine protease
VRLRVTHTTRYNYPLPASNSFNEVRLMPATDEQQTCMGFRLTLEPHARLFEYDLPTGKVHHFNLPYPHDSLVITAESLVETLPNSPLQSPPLRIAEQEFYNAPMLWRKYHDYLVVSSRVPHLSAVQEIAQQVRARAGQSTVPFLLGLNHYLHHTFQYVPGTTNVNTPLYQFLAMGRGVCQDFAHLMLAVCRSEGIPARYVSGYLYTGAVAPEEASPYDSLEHYWSDEEDITPHNGNPHLISGDATHAWIECLLPNGSWCGFDPTNNILTDTHYIKIHTGRDYDDVVPVRGIYWGLASTTPHVAVQIVAVPEGQKVAK